MVSSRVAAVLVAAVAAVAATAAAAAPAPPPAPVLPPYWTASFVAAWLATDGSATNCSGSGYQYYNSDALLLRTDWTFGPACTFVSTPVTSPAVMEVQDAQHGVLRHYHIRFNESSVVCEAFPTAGWVAPTYLSNATYAGTATITTAWGAAVATNVWNATGLYQAGYVLTYTPTAAAPAGSPPIVRQLVLQGMGFNSYQMDYITQTAVDVSAVPAAAFNPYPAVGCMPF